MTDRRPRAVLAAVVALAAGAALAVASSSRPDSEERRLGREFQALVGGLGFGPAVDLERCASELDPRVGSPDPVGVDDAWGPCGSCPRSPLSPAGP